LNTIGNSNTATGNSALGRNTTGNDNTATGLSALANNLGGNSNTANGFEALSFNTTGSNNTATGDLALACNLDGGNNTAMGKKAMHGDSVNGSAGSDNTATGYQALFDYTTGSSNTANGYLALNKNTTGSFNIAICRGALYNNTIASNNVATGYQALHVNQTGTSNTATGYSALGNSISGSGNVSLGASAGASVRTASHVICIGADGNDVSNSCYIGQIFGSTSGNGVGVFVNSNGRLGTMTSSARFKDDIKPMAKTSETILALKPVSFRYKKEIDPARRSQFGLVAEDVEKVNPDLVVRDNEGKPYSVRYDQVNAMLLNEFLKEHRTVQELRSEMAALTATVKEQAAEIQKVSAKLEVNESRSRTVLNDRQNDRGW
jgi:hypothetical protein